MKKIKISLSNQLIIIISLSFIIMIISLIRILPESLEPFFEQTVYSYLEKPLEIFDINQNKNQEFKNIVYIQYYKDKIYISNNYKEVLKVKDYKKLIKYVKISNTNSTHGKFIYKKRIYYYFANKMISGNTKIAITSDRYINELRTGMKIIVVPIIVITFLVILILLLLWSDLLVRKIGKLKVKINNMTNPNFKATKNRLEFDDELYLLDETIDKMKELILENEKYRREMYQNISHDFKTPITVVKSYIEAYKDNVKDVKTVLKVSEEQMEILEKKVKTLLEFNKITYLQNSYKNDKTIEILPIINNCIEKYKIINGNLSYKVNSEKKKIIYNGTIDIWESIINNILSNAIRYAKKEITITLKEDKIIFFNDGENIKTDIIKDIFLPYKKGLKGESGLGLSIVKGNCDLISYKILVKNKKNGVEFIISK